MQGALRRSWRPQGEGLRSPTICCNLVIEFKKCFSPLVILVIVLLFSVRGCSSLSFWGESRGIRRQTDTKKVVGSGVVLSNASLKEERIETLATTVRYVVPMARPSTCRAG